MSENLLLARRTSPAPRAEHRPVTPLPAAEFALRNSPTDLVFRALWQLVGVYVFLVLLVKDRRLPR